LISVGRVSGDVGDVTFVEKLLEDVDAFLEDPSLLKLEIVVIFQSYLQVSNLLFSSDNRQFRMILQFKPETIKRRKIMTKMSKIPQISTKIFQ
jgi:hypothetical protein